MYDHGVKIYSLYQAKFLDRVTELLKHWTWEQWVKASKEDRDAVAAQAIADLLRQANQDEAWDIWDRWSVRLTAEDFEKNPDYGEDEDEDIYGYYDDEDDEDEYYSDDLYY